MACSHLAVGCHIPLDSHPVILVQHTNFHRVVALKLCRLHDFNMEEKVEGEGENSTLGHGGERGREKAKGSHCLTFGLGDDLNLRGKSSGVST